MSAALRCSVGTVYAHTQAIGYVYLDPAALLPPATAQKVCYIKALDTPKSDYCTLSRFLALQNSLAFVFSTSHVGPKCLWHVRRNACGMSKQNFSRRSKLCMKEEKKIAKYRLFLI